MSMKSPPPREGYQDRGMLVPAYPTPEQVEAMEAMQSSLRAAWNWLVSRVETALEAKDAKAVREGLMLPPIPKPNYKGLEREEAKARKQEYIAQCKERRSKVFDLKIPVEWRPRLSGKDSEAKRLGLKQNYQVINWHLRCCGLPELPAHITESLIHNYEAKSERRKKFKRQNAVMPIQVRSGPVIRVRKPKATDSWHQQRCNAEVNLPKAGWIAVYLDPGLLNQLLTPGNTAREGCTLRYEHGRWFASVKIIRRISDQKGPEDGSVVGIDPGLANLAATSDGKVLKNPRNLKYAAAREAALGICDLMPDGAERNNLKSCVFRHDARQSRRVLTQCRQFAAYLAQRYQYIGIEKNSGIALGQGSRYVGVTKTLVDCLIQKCGEARVREVESPYNSQDCSQCGFRDKDSWARRLGSSDQVCQCKSCGLILDRDVNAARNVRNKLLGSIQNLAA